MASNYHSRILRESLRNRDGDHSVASSTGSRHGTVSPDSTISGSSFNPDQNDPYSESTRMFGTPNHLPKLRDSAKKYKYPSARSQSPEMIIDTSALRKSFPNFSQSPRDRVDMEKIARLANPSRTFDPTPTRFSKAENTNQQKPSIPTTKEPVRQTSTQKKENIAPSNYVSGATKSRDGAVRRTLADLNPKVRDESDHSFVSDRLEKSSRFSTTDYTQQSQNDTQQSKVHPNVKTTRNASQKSSKPAVPHKATPYYKAQEAKAQENTTLASSNLHNPTQQSFILPKRFSDMSDLVTATFKDGSPVYVESGAVQSRFNNSGKPLPQKYGVIDGIEVPQDEQDIFLNLEMMQERITQLEGDKSDAQRIANDLDKENYKLREELKQATGGRRRSDSAIADTGADAEKSKLQDEINRLKADAEASKRKIQTLELHLTNNTTERDRAISRVAEFNKTCEHLKSENLGLRNEIDGLRQQGEHVANQREASQQELQQNEASWHDLRTELEERIAVQEDKALGYQRFIANIQKSYTELEQRAKSSKEEVAVLKHKLQISKTLYANASKCDCQQKEQSFEQKEAEWQRKVYRLEKALRKVVSLKLQEYLLVNNLDFDGSVQKLVQESIQKHAQPTKETPRPLSDANVGDAFQDSAFSAIEIEDTVKTQKTAQDQGNTTTPRNMVSSTKENTSPKKTGKSTGVSSKKSVPPFTVNSGTKVTSNGSKTTVPPFTVNSGIKVTSKGTVGPKAALTNAALKAHGLEDFTFEFDHDDDLTQSTNLESIAGPGLIQGLRDNVVNAANAATTAQMQTATSTKKQAATSTHGDADLTSKSQKAYSDVETDVFNSNVKGKNSTSLNKSNTRQRSDQRRRSDSNFDLGIPAFPSKNQSFRNAAETPLEIHQRRRSEGSLDLTGINNDANHTIDSMFERSTVLRKRSQSQASATNHTGRMSSHRRNNSDNMTSAYIIPDIDVTAGKQERERLSDARVCGHGFPSQGPDQSDACARTASKQGQQRERTFSNVHICGHGFPYQGPDQCDTCARIASSIVDAHESCKDLSVLIPVSERMPAAVDGQDEPTLRPSMPPMEALTRVIRELEGEEKHIKSQLSGLEYDLRVYDSSLAKSRRDSIAADLRELLATSQKKADQIYFLYDVLEGLKEAEEWSGIQD